MSEWYRVARTNDVVRNFSGDGGIHTAGRWNQLGRRAVYCSQSISLCTLEWLSNHGLSVSGFDYYKYAIEIPDKLILLFEQKDLPKDWHATPATSTPREFAEQHLFRSTKYLAMQVPSVIVPEEYNLVINPLHEAYADLQEKVKELGMYKAPDRVYKNN